MHLNEERMVDLLLTPMSEDGSQSQSLLMSAFPAEVKLMKATSSSENMEMAVDSGALSSSVSESQHLKRPNGMYLVPQRSKNPPWKKKKVPVKGSTSTRRKSKKGLYEMTPIEFLNFRISENLHLKKSPLVEKNKNQRSASTQGLDERKGKEKGKSVRFAMSQPAPKSENRETRAKAKPNKTKKRSDSEGADADPDQGSKDYQQLMTDFYRAKRKIDFLEKQRKQDQSKIAVLEHLVHKDQEDAQARASRFSWMVKNKVQSEGGGETGKDMPVGFYQEAVKNLDSMAKEKTLLPAIFKVPVESPKSTISTFVNQLCRSGSVCKKCGQSTRKQKT